MTRRSTTVSLALGLLALGSSAGSLHAQNPDLALTEAERDSILAGYHNIFPLLGRKAIERGFDLPKPLGINLIGVYVNQGIDLGQLGLSTGSDPTVPIDAIKFGDNTSNVTTANLRVDLWVLPFLNVYGIGGTAKANTTVEVTTPIGFTSSVDQTGQYLGVGVTGAFGIKHYFTVADLNWAWTDLEKLDAPVQSRVLSLRLGRSFKISPRNKLGVWLGAMNVKFATETNGSIKLSEAIPPETVNKIRNQLQNISSSPWYQGLTPVQQAVVDSIVNRLLNSSLGDVNVNYHLKKAPSDPWNMLIGANLDLGKRWSLRTEVGILGRYSLLLSTVYRLDL